MRRWLTAFLLVLPLSAQAADPILPLSEVKAGMTGYGLSVFRGTKIEKFGVEVIDVWPKADLDTSWIMIRITSGPPFDRGSGVIAGMSGSPVYLDGKVCGAVAYGFTWPLDPVCFLTPIEDMLKTIDAANEERPNTRVATRTLPLPHAVMVGGQLKHRALISEHPLPAGYRPPDDTLAVERLMTPILVSGLGPQAVQTLNTLLAPYGLIAAQGASGGSLPGPAPKLEPGAALAVGLVTGDIAAAGTGTVTYVDGDTVLGFGHPMMQRNRVELPVGGAYVIDFFASRQRSFKLSSAYEPTGTLTEDGHYGVVGKVGPKAPMIPLSIRLRDADTGLDKTFHCEVTQDADLGPSLALAVAQEAVGSTLGQLPRSMVSTNTTVRVKGYDAMTRQELGVVEGPAEPAAISDLLASLRVVVGDPFDRLTLDGIDLEVTIQRGDQTALIQRAYVDRSVVEPGDTVHVELDLRRRMDGKVLQRTVALKIPDDTPPGKTRLMVVGGVGEPAAIGQLKLLSPSPENTRQLLRDFARSDTDNRKLVTMMALPEVDYAVRGERFPSPSELFGTLLSQAAVTDLERGQAYVRVEEPTDLVILNGAIAGLTVKKPGENGENGQPKKNSIEVVPGWSPADWSRPEPLDATPAWYGNVVAFGPGAVLARQQRQEPADDSPADSAKVEPKDEGEKPQPKPKPAAASSRETKTWLHTTPKDFLQGERANTTVIAEGSVVLGLGAGEPVRIPQPVVWSAAVDANGTAWLATGNGGELWKLPAEGRPTVAWKADVPVVTAVAVAGNQVICATAPDGVIHWLDAAGKQTAELATDGHYVWALLPGPNGTLYAATGAPARLLQITGQQAKTLHEEPAGHLLSLASAPDGSIYAGAEPGKLLRWHQGDSAETVLTTKEPVQAVAVDADGQVYYGDGSAVGVVSPDGTRRVLKPMDGPGILSLLTTKYGLLVALRGNAAPATGSVWVVDTKTEDRRRAFLPEAVAVTALAALDADHVLAAVGCPGQVYRLTLPYAADGTYESPVLDAGSRALWGTFEVGRAETEHGTVKVETRSGYTADPDDGWSPWMPAAGRVNNPAGRYLQYRLALAAQDAASPTVQFVRIRYAQANVAPDASLEAPAAGDYLNKKSTIKWKVTDENGDEPLVELALGAAGDQGWTSLVADQEAKAGKYELDTTKQTDGVYRLRLVADDTIYNPDDPKSTTVVSEPFTIDNTAPEVVIPPLEELKLNAAGRLDFVAVASDKVLLAGGEWRLDEGAWRPLVPEDGLFDSATERVRILTGKVSDGKHNLQLRVRDGAGNEGTAKREIDGPAEAPKP